MNNQGERVVTTNALPPNNQPNLEVGAINVQNSALLKQNNTNQLQNKLGGQNGGKKRHKISLKGGATGVMSNSAPVVQVAPVPSYTVGKAETIANNVALATLANNTQSQAALDKTVGGTQSQAAAISAQQQAVYNGTGGTHKKRSHRKYIKKGGSYPKWGCFSGGKKSRRNKKSCRQKNKKSRKHSKKYYL